MTPRKRPAKKRKTSGKAAASKGLRPRYLPDELAEFYKPVKKPVTLRLDADILAWFQKQGRGYQTRINRALRTMMTEAGRKSR
jgi:uncharacterized protein (DUF4415 family)